MPPISVSVSSSEDTDRVGDVLKQIALEMREDPAFKDQMRSDLQLWGVDKVDGAVVTLVGQIVCTDSGRWGVQREFNRRYKKALPGTRLRAAQPDADGADAAREAGTRNTRRHPGR